VVDGGAGGLRVPSAVIWPFTLRGRILTLGRICGYLGVFAFIDSYRDKNTDGVIDPHLYLLLDVIVVYAIIDPVWQLLRLERRIIVLYIHMSHNSFPLYGLFELFSLYYRGRHDYLIELCRQD
jgi:hypothetical protein